jgi:hypothetical protein
LIAQDNPKITELARPLLDSLKDDGIYQDAIAKAISDRVIDTAQEIGSAARQTMEGIDWASELLLSIETQGFSEDLQQRLDDLGALGEVVKLRIQLALVQYTNELALLKEESDKLVANEKEAVKLELEKRWEIQRNGNLTRIQWLLTALSFWPILLGLTISTSIGFLGGVLWLGSTQSQQTMERK